MSVAERFAENMARERRLAGLTQDEVSVRAGIHRTEVSQLERGLRVPRIDTLVKVAAALECKPAALLAGLAWKPAETLGGRFEVGGG